MKKSHIIFGSTIILLATTLTAVALKVTDGQLEKVIVQTELYPMKVIETNGQTRTLWVQAKNNKAKTMSFLADKKTVDEILLKLKSSDKK